MTKAPVPMIRLTSANSQSGRGMVRDCGCEVRALQAAATAATIAPVAGTGPRFTFCARHHGPVRLHHEPRRQDRSAEAPDPQEHFAVILPRRQDRHARRQRLGQEHAAQDHGRHRQGDRGRSHADARPEDRLPAAGAAARRRPDRARGGRAGHRRRAGGQEAAGRGLRRVRRGERRLRRARRRAGRTRSHHRRRRQREHRPAARAGRRRAAPAALGRPDRRALGRREAPRRAVPAAAEQARHAAARRAHQPPRRRIGRVAGAVPAALPRHRGGDHPRPLLPRQRRRVDPRTRPRLGHPLEGQLLRLARPEGAAPGAGAEDRRRAHEGDEGGAEVGALQRQGAPDQEQGAPGALRGTQRRRVPAAQRHQRDLHPGGRAPGQRGHRVQGCQQELRRPAADRQAELSRCRRVPSSASSARTAPASRRCFACCKASRSPTAARS